MLIIKIILRCKVSKTSNNLRISGRLGCDLVIILHRSHGCNSRTGCRSTNFVFLYMQKSVFGQKTSSSTSLHRAALQVATKFSKVTCFPYLQSRRSRNCNRPPTRYRGVTIREDHIRSQWTASLRRLNIISPSSLYLWHVYFCVKNYPTRRSTIYSFSVDKKNQLDVTFCILYLSSNSCSTCFGEPCAHHQELTTEWCYSLVLVCAVAAGRLSRPVGR